MDVYAKLQDPAALAVFVVTLILPVLIGLVAFWRTRSQADFYVGGRAMSKVTVALSAISSGRSSWLVLGFTGIAYTRGTGALWAAVGYITVEALQFVYIGRRLREQTERQGAITLLDYFAARFGDRRHLLRITGAVICGVFLTAYVAAQLNAGAKSLATALEWQLLDSLLVSAGLIVVYMALGGFVAVAYNDVVRAVIMLVGLVVLPVYVMAQIPVADPELGHVSYLFTALEALDPKLIDPLSLGLGGVVGFVGIGLGSPGQPHIVVRYMSIADPRQLRFAAILGTCWNIVLAWGALFIGLLGRVLVPDVNALPKADPEMVYLVLSAEHFAPVVYGLLVGGVFAAILSTADSQLLVIASTVTRDVIEKMIYRGREIGEAQKLWLSRGVVVLAGLLAVIIAYIAEDLVFWLVLFAWGGLGASFGPALILSLYWRRTHRWGVFAGMVTGTLVTIVWKLWLKKPTGLYELIPAFFLAALAIVSVSLLLDRGDTDAPD